MAKRRPPNDDQWDRTSGGLIVPRRGVSLPTRRWIGWMGGAKDCCDVADDTCPLCISGAFNGSVYVPSQVCGWDIFEGTYVLANWTYDNVLKQCTANVLASESGLIDQYIILRFRQTGLIQIDINGASGGGVYYALDPFGGSPPFAFYDIVDLEIPLDSGDCYGSGGSLPEYVIFSNS